MSEKIFRFHDETRLTGGVNWRITLLDEAFLLHTHDYYELEYASEGTGVNVINGVEYPIEAGSLWILGPNDDHMLTGNHVRVHHLGIYLPDTSRELASLLEGASFPMVGTVEPSSRAALPPYFSLFADAPEDDALREKHYQAVATLILAKGLSLVRPTSGTVNKTASYVRSAIRYIHEHLREPLTLSSVANELHIVPCYLSSIFSSHAGCPFNEYVTRSRLRHARALLLHTDKSVTDVAGESGFGCVSAMNRAFRKHLDTTPSALRKYGSA